MNAEVVADLLGALGFDADAYPDLEMVKVYDPDDTVEMYDRVDEWMDGAVDVRMTNAEVFQILLGE